MGKLIVFEGIDGSGKSTQLNMMCRRFEEENRAYMYLAFPQYAEPSSALIRMYLAGEFGKNPGDVNAYAASSFYAVDRYASYIKSWGEYYKNGGIILADRYTTSNAIHQASKVPDDKRKEFFQWLYEFEYKLMELPVPDTVIYMDIPVHAAVSRMRQREQETNTRGDIHETDLKYLESCYRSGEEAADFYGWQKIQCLKDGKMRTADDIHEEIYQLLMAKQRI